MKSGLRLILIITFVIVSIVSSSIILDDHLEDKKMASITLEKNALIAKANVTVIEEIISKQADTIDENTRIEVIDGMTVEELASKLDGSMNYELDGYELMFAEHATNIGLDPYLALAVVLHETGCKWGCSYLARECNNFGGQKGSVDGNSCGSYKYYPTKEAGLIGFLDNLYYNFYAEGLTTPELINPRYAESNAWSNKINMYINEIRAN